MLTIQHVTTLLLQGQVFFIVVNRNVFVFPDGLACVILIIFVVAETLENCFVMHH